MTTPSYTDFNSLERAKKFSQTLKSFGFPEIHYTRKKGNIVFAFVIGLSVVFLMLTETFGIKGQDAATAVFAIGSFLLAFQQWDAARYEASLDKYYERLDLSNTRFEKLDDVDGYIMYIFMEIDNLEYIIEKYKWAYVSKVQAFRALKTFYAHCRDINQKNQHGVIESMNDLAEYWVEKAGYMNSTTSVIKKVCTHIKAVRGNPLDK